MKRRIALFWLWLTPLTMICAQTYTPMTSVNPWTQEPHTTLSTPLSPIGATQAPPLYTTTQMPCHSPRKLPGSGTGEGVDWGNEHEGQGEGGTDITLPVGDGLDIMMFMALLGLFYAAGFYVQSARNKPKKQVNVPFSRLPQGEKLPLLGRGLG